MSVLPPYEADWFSVACLERLMNPSATVDTILQSMEGKPPAAAILSHIQSLRQRLGIPDRYLSSQPEMIQEYISDTFTTFCQTQRMTSVVFLDGHTEATADEVIVCLEWLLPKESISKDRSLLKFAILCGIALGSRQWFAYPRTASVYPFEIVEGVAKKMYERPTQPPTSPFEWMTDKGHVSTPLHPDGATEIHFLFSHYCPPEELQAALEVLRSDSLQSEEEEEEEEPDTATPLFQEMERGCEESDGSLDTYVAV